MDFVAALCLRALHYIYSFFIICSSVYYRNLAPPPHPSRRHRIPEHLALLLVCDKFGTEFHTTLVQTVADVVDWCRAAGINHITLYEEHGLLLKCSQHIRECFSFAVEEDSSDSEIEFPPTPPSSDYSESRPMSPQSTLQANSHILTLRFPNSKSDRSSSQSRRRKSTPNQASQDQLILRLTSRKSAKPTIASIAEALALSSRRPRKRTSVRTDAFSLGMNELENILELDHTLSPPDFMIVHPFDPLADRSAPLELHGFPPWQIRLTEIYHNTSCYQQETSAAHLLKYIPLTEDALSRALDQFSAAEMRFGK